MTEIEKEIENRIDNFFDNIFFPKVWTYEYEGKQEANVRQTMKSLMKAFAEKVKAETVDQHTFHYNDLAILQEVREFLNNKGINLRFEFCYIKLENNELIISGKYIE